MVDFLRFLVFSLRPMARSPEIFDWLDVFRAFGALGGIGGLGWAGRWLDNSVEAAERSGGTPDWFFAVLFPLVGFASLAIVAGTRLSRRLRLSLEPVLVIEQKVRQRGDALHAGETFGLVVANERQASANNCVGQIIELALLHPGESISMESWTGGNLQWSPQTRDPSNEAIARISGLLSGDLDIVHHHRLGFSKTRFSSFPKPQFLFAYANDSALAFDYPPPSNLEVLLAVIVKGDNIAPIYAVCLFNPKPTQIVDHGPLNEDGSQDVSLRQEPYLEILKISDEKPNLANFQQPIPDIADSQSQ